MPTTVTWNVNADGDWDTAADWSTGIVPDSNNNVVINTTSIHTITHNGGSDTIGNLNVGNDHFILNGGTLAVTNGASFGLDYQQYGGLLTGADAIYVTGVGDLLGGSAQGTLSFLISGVIALGNYTLGGSDTLSNSATVNQTAGITLGDATGVNATISNTGAYNIAGDYGVSQGAASAALDNTGTLSKIAGSGVSNVNVNVNDSGAISVSTGQLQFNGPSNTFTGTIGGAGQFAIGGGVSLIFSETITAAQFDIYNNGTLVNLGSNLSYAGAFGLGEASTINLGGFTLTLTGSASFYQNFGAPTINGSGTLSTSGATTLNAFTLGGSVNWINTGTVTQTSTDQIGDGGASGATFTNQSAGQFDIVSDTNLNRGAALTSSFVNAGTLAKTAGNGTSFIYVDVASTGTVSAATGNLQFDGPNNSFAGTISGAGAVTLGGGGADTIAAGASITVSNFSIHDNGTTVTLGGNLTYANNFTMAEATVINLNGHNLTLSGTNSIYQDFGVPTINGAGTLATSGATTLNVFTLGGTVNWSNTGTVTQVGTDQIGDGSSSAATFTNQSAGQFDIANDTNIARGAAATSTFVNSGTLAKTAGNGTSYVYVDVTNTGTIAAATGNLQFDGPNNSFGGTISGASAITLGGGGLDAIAAGASITVSNFSLHDNGTTATLGGNLTYANNFTMGEATSVNLNGHTLTLTGAVNLNQDFGVPYIGGSGTLATSGATGINLATLGGTVNWINTGTVTQTAALQVGDGGTGAATFTNQSAGQFNIANDTNISRGAAATSTFVNAGKLAKTAGNATSFVYVDVASTGTISVASGNLQFDGPNNSFAGTISGPGAFTLGGGGVDTIASGAAITVGAFSLRDNGTTATLGGNLTYAGAFTMGEATDVNLNGHTLTLTGPANLFQDFGVPTINGSGALSTTGATSVNGFTLGGSAKWTNTGTITEVGNLQIGDGGASGATLTNAATGAFAIANDSGISVGAASTSAFNNAGAFVKTGGSGTSVISVAFNNTGTVTANTGQLEFTNAVTGAGAWSVGLGGYLYLGSSVSAGALSFAGTSGTLALGNLGAFNGSVSGFVAGDTLDLTGQVVTSMTYTGTKLTVSLNNGTTKTINFSSAVTALQAVGDGNGGTDILALPAGPYALTTAQDIWAFASGTNTVSATATTLLAGDSLTGGTGVDTLALSGGGSFNLAALNAFSFDAVTVAAGSNYTITAGNNDVGAGKVAINGLALGSGNSLNFNASAATKGAFSINGGAGADTIVGGGTTDAINGKGGNDTLTGGAGVNNYFFTTALNAATNDPTITNFHTATDLFNLSHTVFTALTAGALPAADFAVGSAATTTSQHILYNSATGALLYDPDGSGSAAAVQFATVSTGLNLTAANFNVT